MNIEDVELSVRVEDEWCVIERARHDGASWFKKPKPGVLSYQHSRRFSDADVEGTPDEMMDIAAAIESEKSASFRRCAVDPVKVGGKLAGFAFCSPRNSQRDGVVTVVRAKALAALIRLKVHP